MTLPAALAQRYDALCDALSHRDARALATLVGDAPTRATLLALAHPFVSLRVRVDATDVRETERSITVSAQYTFDGTQPARKGKAQPHHSVESVEDTWQRSGDTWLLTSQQVSQGTEIVD